jgi:hypothetical protein
VGSCGRVDWQAATTLKGVALIFQSDRVEPVHPADTLGVAINRAIGVLSALTACHDPQRGGFAVNEQFLLQAVAAVESFVSDARDAYLTLCDSCDLRLSQFDKTAEGRPGGAATSEKSSDELHLDAATVLPALPTLAGVADVSMPVLPVAGTGSTSDVMAESYDELLRKVTAAEVFAATRAGGFGAGQNNPLLPLLQSLRQDLEKLRAA